MGSDAALKWVESLVYAKTGRHLSDLQCTILRRVWQGQRYLEIARHSGYTEGHIKDVAYQLWQILSAALDEKVSKTNLRSVLERWVGQDGPMGVSEEGAKEFAGGAIGAIAADPSPSRIGHPGGLLGREAAIAHLDHLLQQGYRTLVIQGEGGLGKTTLAQHYLANRAFDQVLELLMAKETADIVPVEQVVEEWLRQDFGMEPGREFGITLGRLKRQLAQHRVGILMDNLEPALDAQGCFLPAHRRYCELLRVLSDPRSQSVTLVTSRDRLCEPGLTLPHYRLPGLSLATWEQFRRHQGLTLHPPTLQAMHTAYGGNAKAMEILCGVIQTDFDGDMAAYWQQHSQDLLSAVDLKNLVDSQVSRLRTLDPEAYRILCRLGVYRYQAVPMIPGEAIFHLMADIPPERHPSLLAGLRNRSLVECHKGEYWLHPVVRADAIARLRASPDWETTHRQAAAFWTQRVQQITTLQSALQALEAYYHWVAVQDYGAAARVILQSRDNRWQQFLPLGSTLYRMGLIQPVMEAITAIIDHLPQENADTSELYNILGDLYWIRGEIPAAIACQENAIAIAQDCLARSHAPADTPHRLYYLTMLAVDSCLSLGLYALDLWDLTRAAALFQQVIDQARHTPHHRWAEKATVCLALVKSHQGDRTTARILAESMQEAVLQDQQTGRYAFFIQRLGQTFGNLGEAAIAHTLFQAAIAAAEAGHYTQVKANTLSGLGQIARRQGDWESAIGYHEQAIRLLEELGAKCDLAEAHYQLGLTYQTLRPHHPHPHFQTALQLFSEIPAPLQVHKIMADIKKG